MKKHYLAYNNQKHNAKKRKIDFQFTYYEWVAWWKQALGPEWHVLRGCRKDQYVMARWYDDGPYVAHNVKCILASKNHLERNRRLWAARRRLKAVAVDWYAQPVR